VSLDGRRAEILLDLAHAESATVETLRLAGGRAVAIVKAQAGSRAVAALIGVRGNVPAFLWSGHLDPRGDPGERRSDAIEVEDRSGDSMPDVIVGVLLESTRVCGEPQTLLSTRAVDPATGALRPVELRRLPAGAEELEMEPSTQSPGPTGPPLLGGLSFVQASSSAGGPSDPTLVSPPVGLGDGDVATHWAEGRGGAGRWEFATARYPDGNIRALTITLAAPPVARPAHLWLVGDAAPRLRVTVPTDAPVGQPLWIVPPTPLPWRCVSVVLDDAGAGAGPTGLAEVTAYGDLDFGDGLARLVEEIVADGSRGARAAEVLARAGDAGRDAILEAWPTLTATGRRRAVRILAAHSTHPPALAALAAAAGDDDEMVREAALETLVAAGDVARPALGRLTLVQSDAGDRAALALAVLAPAEAIDPILAAVDADGGTERAGLRRAVRTAYRGGDQEARGRFSAWAEGAEAGPAAAVALALAKTEEGALLSAELITGAVGDAERFEDRYRLVKAAAEGRAEPETDRWLAGVATSADEWMLRAEALAALGARSSPALDGAARSALEDEYPRVRVTAATVLAGRRGTLRAVATLARRDPWPMVRGAATEALASVPDARPILLASLGDRAQSVRAAAVRALTARGDRSAAEAIGERLGDDDEWPEVIQASIAYARAVCVQSLVDPLVGVLRRGMRPNAWAPDVDLAVLAVQVLGVLGGEDAEAAVRSASSPSADGAIRAAALVAQREETRCATGD